MQPGGPMYQVGMISPDGRPYIDLDKSTYIIGLVGLNECVKFLMDQELHESDEAYKLGIKIISAMYLKIKELEKEHNLKFTLEETPAESASLRLAKLDLREYPESKDYVRGDQKTGEVYYTNSIHFTPDAPVDILERIEKQAKFNTLIESGAITHVFLGEQKPDIESVYNLVKRTWENTQSAQITISPEFTVCNDCHKVSRGYRR
jgi:ribonucleoside-triphosphate reductase